jgi:hypothetical protein
MQQIPWLFEELRNAQRKLLKLFDAPETMCDEGRGYSPMFPWPFTSVDRSDNKRRTSMGHRRGRLDSGDKKSAKLQSANGEEPASQKPLPV